MNFQFYRSIIVAGKETEQKVLSASLLLNRTSGESQMSDLLRTEIVNGKLGKFQVAAFPDKFKGLIFIHYCLVF